MVFPPRLNSLTVYGGDNTTHWGVSDTQQTSSELKDSEETFLRDD